MSEHDPSVHHVGRLSMWRAYGEGKTPVALVLNKNGLFTQSDSVNLFMSPVAYLNDEQTTAFVERTISEIESNHEFLTKLDPELVTRSIFVMLLFGSICLKHPGFAEETEWRLIYLPRLAISPIVEESISTINGVPQTVYKVPLQDRPDHNLIGIEIRELLNQVIVGPTAFPFPVCEAFVDVLNRAGVPDANQKVVAANIPLRT